MAQPPVVTAEMARSHRLRAHHLAAPLPPGAYCEAAAACGLQNSPPGAFETALFARVQGASPAGIRRALYEEKSLLQAWSLRGAPAVFPTRDSDRVPVRAAGRRRTEQPWVYTRGIGLALGRLSMTVQQLWPLVRGAAQQCLGRQAIVGKPALDAAVAALALPQLPVEDSPCGTAPRPMAGRTCRRWAGPWPRFFCARAPSSGWWCSAAARARCPRSPRPRRGWARRCPAPRQTPPCSLVRRFSALLRPRHARRASKLAGRVPGAGKAHVGRRSARNAAREAGGPHRLDAGAGRARPAGRRAGAAAAFAAWAAHDPYLDVHGPREKALLLPDAARHKAVWQTVSNPGVLLTEPGPLQACGARSAQGKGLALSLHAVCPALPGRARAGAAALAQRYAAFRGQRLAACTLEELSIQFVFFILFVLPSQPARHTGQKAHKKHAPAFW